MFVKSRWKGFEAKAFENAFINGADQNIKALLFLKGNIKCLQDMS